MRKKHKRYYLLQWLLVFTVLSNTLVVQAGSTKDTQKGKQLIREMQFSTDQEEKDLKFEETIKYKGKKYKLQDVKQEVIDQTSVKVEKEVEKIIDSEPLAATYEPEQTIEENGITYTLDRVEEKEGVQSEDQKVTGYTDYDHPVSSGDVPATKKVTVKDNQTGENKTVTCKLQGVTPLTQSAWEDTYIAITFESYDANIFQWNGVTVGKSTSNPLEGYEKQLLQSVGANTSDYRVLRTYWTGEAYRDGNGVLCRNARADVQRKVQYYRANYAGTIEHPEEAIYTAYYKGVEIIESDENFIYTINVTATYELQDNTVYIVATVGILLLLLLIVLILFLLRKKKKKEEITTN